MEKINIEKFIILVTIGLFVMCMSCNQSFCIKVDGKYQDKTGSVEYCYDPSKGLFNSISGKSVLVSKDELEQIKKESEQTEVKASNSSGNSNSKLIDKILERFK